MILNKELIALSLEQRATPTQADTREAVLPELPDDVKDALDWCALPEPIIGYITTQATALTELRAECERLRGEMAQAQHRHALAMESKHTAWELAIEQRDIAEARADEAERDAARYRWLSENFSALSVAEQYRNDMPNCLFYRSNLSRPWSETEAAIDAALKDHP